jgi:hypothetical protein
MWARCSVGGSGILTLGFGYAARANLPAALTSAIGGAFLLLLSGVLYARRLVELGIPAMLSAFRENVDTHGAVPRRRRPSDYWSLVGIGGITALAVAMACAAQGAFGLVVVRGAVALAAVGGCVSAFLIFRSGVLYARRLVQLGKPAKLRLLREKGGYRPPDLESPARPPTPSLTERPPHGDQPPKVVGGGWFGVPKPANGGQGRDPPRCGFCGKVGNQGVMGTAAFICFDCIDLAAEIKGKSLGDKE